MIKIYNCFHDEGSKPNPKYISNIRPALLCGAALDFRFTEGIQDVLRDNVGENISNENEQYSEMTGYYWVWKNELEKLDYVGIEHYRRHFIKHQEIKDNYVQTSDLFTENEIIPILQKYDFIVPVHESLVNITVYDLYRICFGVDEAINIVKYMKKYFTLINKQEYIEGMYRYLSHNSLYRANMLITSKNNFNEYCQILFDMIDYMKDNMIVKEKSRVWGYVTELFPMIYILANNKSYKEVDVAIDDFDQEEQKEKVYTTLNNTEGEYIYDPEDQVKMFKDIPID